MPCISSIACRDVSADFLTCYLSPDGLTKENDVKGNETKNSENENEMIVKKKIVIDI